MKAILTLLVIAAFAISVVPSVLATDVGGGITPDIQTEDFEPLVWMCDQRVVVDDPVQWGRVSQDGQGMLERSHNYAFEGEQISWLVLVMDKNGVPEKLSDVYATIGSSQGEGNDIEVNCEYLGDMFDGQVLDSCNARIQEEHVTWNSEMMGYYQCTLTVETPDSMYGEYWVTVEAEDLDGLLGTMDENEYWFFNPMIALSIDGDMTFEDVRPGALAYSDTLLVGNDADSGSGVMMDMFISGTDFYDSSSSGAMCPNSNILELSNFRYFATNGAYSTALDMQQDSPGKPVNEGIYDIATQRNRDAEGYINIQYGDHWDRSMYYEAEIIQSGFQPEAGGPAGYYRGNILSPGGEMAVTFKLDLPEPCNGDFDTGMIYFWGEAI
ncbi:MAG: hypothetical protein KKD18_01000 [Nanoarchaeota archaeon]|nr:hypothetical protein [Nanoarchaeota archaeon]